MAMKPDGRPALVKIKLSAGRMVQGQARIIVQNPGDEIEVPEDEAARIIEMGAAKRVEQAA